MITAAHCIKSANVSSFSVVLGKTTREREEESGEGERCGGAQLLRVRKIVVHENFNPRELTYDLALVFVSSRYNQSARFADDVQPACLPRMNKDSLRARSLFGDDEEEFMYEAGESGVTSGWGLTDEGDRRSAAKRLQFVSVPMVHTERCAADYRELVQIREDIQFCAGKEGGGQVRVSTIVQ